MAYDTWGGSWGGSWALSWTRSDTAPAPPATPSVGGGRPHRGRTRHYVVIDGRDIEVRSIREAQQILMALREKKKKKPAVKKLAPPVVEVFEPVTQKIPARPDSFTHELQASIDATNAAIMAANKLAFQRAESEYMRYLAADNADIEDLITLGVI